MKTSIIRCVKFGIIDIHDICKTILRWADPIRPVAITIRVQASLLTNVIMWLRLWPMVPYVFRNPWIIYQWNADKWQLPTCALTNVIIINHVTWLRWYVLCSCFSSIDQSFTRCRLSKLPLLYHLFNALLTKYKRLSITADLVWDFNNLSINIFKVDIYLLNKLGNWFSRS